MIAPNPYSFDTKVVTYGSYLVRDAACFDIIQRRADSSVQGVGDLRQAINGNKGFSEQIR
jgi:hypothetical protein